MLGGGEAVVAVVEVVQVEPRVALKADVAATLPPVKAVADERSEDGMSRVELFPIGARFAALAIETPAVRVEAGVVEPPVKRETSVVEGAGPMLDVWDREEPLVEYSAAPVADAVAAPPVARRRPKTASELAEAGQTPEGLLARAHALLATGADDEAAVQLRACARLASRLKVPAVEAVARLELGDLCQSHGDMTTACEHWQIARALYGDLKRAEEATAAEKRMEKAGCPTDWVLTKF